MFDVYEISDVMPLGASLLGFIYATRLRFIRVLVKYGLELPSSSQVNLRVLVPVHFYNGLDPVY
jgi:hypothetical protein